MSLNERHPPHGSDNSPSPESLPVLPVYPSMELHATESVPADADLAGAISAEPVVPPAVDVELAPVEAAPPAPSAGVGHGLWHWVLPGLFLLTFVILVLYAAPYLIYHWRVLEGRGEAEAIYLKRRAELKAEAEHADERLNALDKRVQLTSLGFREVVRKVGPKVVNVANYRAAVAGELAVLARKGIYTDPDDGQRYVQIGVGSGVLVRPGIILTNFHVVRGTQRLRITFASGQSVGVAPDAIAPDAVTDLAVVRLPDDLPEFMKDEVANVCDFADSDRDVQVGDFALAIGSPLGLRQTVTQGVISAKGRLLQMLDLVELLQTDAPINPGNSGGPLFDQYGRVVGINVAIASDNGGNQGIGFAIPSNVARRIAKHLIDHGSVPRGYLGIALAEVTPTEARTLKIAEGGVAVKQILPGEAAERAGLKAGDVIVKFKGEPLSRFQPVRHLRALIVDVDPGTEVTLQVLRDGAPRDVAVTVGKRPANVP